MTKPARLVAIAGPFRGASFPIEGDECSIGRDETNAICLEDSAVSRRHCLIAREAKGFRLRDLGAQNRIYVNGLPVREDLLRAGDEIKIGRSLFLIVLENEGFDPRSGPIVWEQRELSGQSTVVLRPEEALYLDPARTVASLSSGYVVQHLKVMLKTGEAISIVSGLEMLAQRLMELAAEAIPAQRITLLLFSDNDPEEIEHEFHWERPGTHTPRRGIPLPLLRKVVEERISVWNKPGGAGNALECRSELAVPLPVLDHVIGAVFVETANPAVLFEHAHLELLTGIAGVASGALNKALHLERLEAENRLLLAEINLDHNMIGESPRMRSLHQFIARVAPTDSTVLITGESGTGKELVARAIHRSSRRAARLFMAVNCATLDEKLADSQLFGHERGAFTDAYARRKGMLEEASGGTLFLDEIGELPLAVQAKFLRALQEREIQPLGTNRSIKVDIRIIAATNRNLADAVKAREFRQDLFFRLNVVSTSLAPLRERREDIPELIRHFLAKYRSKSKRPVQGFSERAVMCLKAYEWPGNIRELEHAVERAIVLGTSEWILPEDLPESIAEAEESVANGDGSCLAAAVKRLKQQMIQDALEQAKGNYSEAARILCMHPNNLHRLIRNLNLIISK